MPLSIFLCLFLDTIRLVSIKNKIKSHYTLRYLTNFLHKFNRTVLSLNVRDVLGVLILIKAAPSVISASISGGSKDEHL